MGFTAGPANTQLEFSEGQIPLDVLQPRGGLYAPACPADFRKKHKFLKGINL